MEQQPLKEAPLSLSNEENPQDSPENEESRIFFIDVNYSDTIILSFSEEKKIVEEGMSKTSNKSYPNDSKRYMVADINDRDFDSVDCNRKAIAAFQQGYLKVATNLLFKIVSIEEDNGQKVNIINRCIYENNLGSVLLRKKEYIEALTHFEKAYSSIVSHFTEKNILAIIILNNMICLYLISEQFQKIKGKENSIQTYLLAEQILTGASAIEDELRIKLYENFGKICKLMSGYKDAQTYLEKSQFAFEKILEIAETNKSKNTQVIARTRENLAEVFYESMNFKKALDQIHKVIEMKKEFFGDLHLEVTESLSFRSKYYRTFGNIPAALKSEEEALDMKNKLFKISPDEKDGICVARSYGELGRIYHSYHDYNLASQQFLKAIEITELVSGKECSEAAGLYQDFGLLKISQSQYKEALSFLQSALEIYKKLYGQFHVNVANTIGDLGLCYLHLENFQASDEHLQKKSSMLQEIYRENDPHSINAGEEIAELLTVQCRYEAAINILQKIEGTVSTENQRSMANIYYRMGQVRLYQKLYQLAVKYFEQSLTIYKAQWRLHEKIALVLECLAECFINQEKRELSVDYCNQAAKIRKKLYPEDHVCHGHSHLAMARFYYKIGQYKSVITELNSALGIYTKHLSENHAEIIKVYDFLRKVYEDLDDDENAEKYFKLAFKVKKKIYGKESFPVAKQYYQIAATAREEEDYAGAIKNYMRVLNAYQVLYGENHEKIADLREVMGHVYYSNHEFENASQSYTITLNIRKSLEDEADVSIADALYNIGRAERRLSHFANAVKAYMESLVIYKKVYGEEHAEVANVLEAIANSYKYEEKYDEALIYYQNSLDIRIKLLGNEDRLVAQSYYNMGLVYYYQRNFYQALKVYLKSLKIYEQIYGQIHEEVADVQETIARVYRALNNDKKALYHYSIVYVITAAERGEDHQYTINIRDALDSLRNKDAKMTIP